MSNWPYFEYTLKLNDSNNSYLDLLDMFFKPKEFFNDKKRFSEPIFEKIFVPKVGAYQDNHKDIEKTTDFLAWNGWLFRGQSNSDWGLKTSLDRLFENISLLNNDEKIITRDKLELEKSIIRDFQRRNYEYDIAKSKTGEITLYELIANMQHYGCATRFLDVTFSFFVALFFACGNLEFSDDSKKKSFSVFCFNRMWIEKEYKKYLPEEVKELYVDDVFGKKNKTQEAIINYFNPLKDKDLEEKKQKFNTIINTTPFNMNKRLVHQKGSFLLQANPYNSFEENLSSLVKEEDGKYKFLKINVEYDNLTLIYLQKFLDEMNINNSVLFQDIRNMCLTINNKAHLPNDALITELVLKGEKH